MDNGEEWTDLAAIQSNLNEKAFIKNTMGYSEELVAQTYPHGVQDFRIDNFPIKAFSIPARNVTERLKGDINGDGKITITDVTYVQRAIAGLAEVNTAQ